MMKLKRILALILVLLMVFAVAACSTSSDKDDNDDDNRSSRKTTREKESGKEEPDLVELLPGLASGDKDDGNGDIGKSSDRDDRGDDEDEGTASGSDEKADQDTMSDTEPGIYYEDSTTTIYKGLLPEGYPEDKFPFMEGTSIASSSRLKNVSGTTFIVMGTVSAPFDEVSDYYTSFLARNAKWEAQMAPGIEYYTGTCFGYQFQIQIRVESESDESTELIIQLVETMSGNQVLAELDMYNPPTGYPEDLFPIIDNHAISYSTKSVYRSDSTEQTTYYLEIYTTHTIDEVLEFYEEVLGEIRNKEATASDDSFYFSGIAYDYSFGISGYKQNKDGAELVFYSISLQYPADN